MAGVLLLNVGGGLATVVLRCTALSLHRPLPSRPHPLLPLRLCCSGEMPFQEAFETADYTGFQGLECAQLLVTTAAPAPQGPLRFTVESAPAAAAAATASTPSASAARRLLMQPTATDSPAGQLVAGDGSAPAPAAGACGVPAAPTLRLRLPAGQQLSSVIWRDSLNRTVHVQSGASLAAVASTDGPWTTAAVALPPLYPFTESSTDPAVACTAPACQQLQRRYSVLVLAADGRHSRADLALSPGSLGGQRLAITYKHYERHSLSFEQGSLHIPLGWPAAAGGNASATGSPAGVAIFAGSRSAPLQLGKSSAAVVRGGSLPDSSCSQQWSLSLQLSVRDDAIAAAAKQAGGRMLLSVDGDYPALSLGPSQLPAAAAGEAALWLHWGPHRRRLALPRSFGHGDETLQLALVRWAGGVWAWGLGSPSTVVEASTPSASHQQPPSPCPPAALAGTAPAWGCGPTARAAGCCVTWPASPAATTSPTATTRQTPAPPPSARPAKCGWGQRRPPAARRRWMPAWSGLGFTLMPCLRATWRLRRAPMSASWSSSLGCAPPAAAPPPCLRAHPASRSAAAVGAAAGCPSACWLRPAAVVWPCWRRLSAGAGGGADAGSSGGARRRWRGL